MDRRPEVIWKLVQVEWDGHNSVTIKCLCSWQGKLRRMLTGFSKASGGEGRLKGNSANAERLQQNKLDLVKHQLRDKRNKTAS